MNEAKISEIFSSFQGEGQYLGVRQVFIRFFGCSLNCTYCDTKFDKYSEYTKEELVKKVMEYTVPYHSVSLTGGEPLEQVEFLKSFLPLLKMKVAKPVYLETNGILYKSLAEIIDNVDIIAMDIKLPSSTGKGPLWEEHRKFLEIAKTKEVFVKIVITAGTKLDEVYKAKDIVMEANAKMPFIVQPVDPIGNIKEPSEKYLNEIKSALARHSSDVRVIPQHHKTWGVK